MKKINKVQIFAVTCLLALTFIVPNTFAQATGTQTGESTAQARTQPKPLALRRRRMMAFMFGRLNLTDAQKAEVKRVMLSHRESIAGLRGEIRARRQEMRQSNQGVTFNEALINQKLTEIAGFQTKLMGERFQMRQQLLAILTPEQRESLREMRQELKTRMAERRTRRV